MPSFTNTELTGQVVHAYGQHIVNPHIVQKTTSGSGENLIATVVGIMGEGVWQGVDLVTWKGRTMVENVDYHFHAGYLPNDPEDSAHNGAQAVDPWIQGGSNYSGSAYIVAKLPVESADEKDFSELKVRAKCLLVMDYDVNGNELGLTFTSNPANVFLDIYLVKRGNPKSRIDFPSWYAWKQFNAEQVTWTGGSIPQRPLFMSLNNVTLGADSSLFKNTTTNAWDAGALTDAIIPNGVVGFFEFDAGAGTFAGGLVDAAATSFVNSNAMKFGVQCNSATPTGSSGILSININGVNTAFGNWVTGDRFRTAIELVNNVPTFKLYKNGIIQNLSGFSIPAVSGNYRGGVAFFHGSTDILRSTFAPINTGGVGTERTRPRFVAGLAFVNTTDTAAAMEAVLYVSCANYYDDGKLHFLTPSTAANPRPVTFTFNESNILDGTFNIYRLTRNQRITHLLGRIRDLDTPYLTEATIPVDRDSLEGLLQRRIDGGEVYLGTMPQGQATCVLNYQLRMTSDFDLFASFDADGTTFGVVPGDIVYVTHSLAGWNNVKCIVIQTEDDETTEKADTRKFAVQVFDSAVYSDTDQSPITINVPYQTPTSQTPAPLAVDVVLEQESSWGLNDAFSTYINGTVTFGDSPNFQRARIWIIKPNDTVPVITNIIVNPQAPNFSLQAQTNGAYTIYAVTENEVGYRDLNLQLPFDYTNETIIIAAPELALSMPVMPTASFSVSSVEIYWQVPANVERITEYEVWTDITNLNDLSKRIYFGSDNRTTYQFGFNAPLNQSFWVRSVNRMGQASAFVPVNNGQSVPIVTLFAPSNYNITFNGVELIHSFTPLPPNANVGSYQIATDSNFTNIVSTGKSGAQLIKLSALPAGRTWNFYLRAVDNLGNIGPTAVPAIQPYSISTFAAPIISFDPNRTYPFNAILTITPPLTLTDKRQVLKTVVETATSPAFNTVMHTYSFDGVAEIADISGRFATQPTIYARAYYVDRTNVAGNISGTASVTFFALGANDIGTGTVGLTQLASGLTTIKIVASLPVLPDTNYPNNNSIVYNQADGKLYRNFGNVWTAAVPTIDLTGQIGSTQISDNAITTPKINANAVTANLIAANAVVAGKVAADAITAGTIAAAAVSARELAAAAVTADKIAAESISARNLIVGGFTDNLLMNSSFEQGFDGWFVYNFNVVETQNVATGSTSAEVVSAADAPDGDKHVRIFSLSNTNGHRLSSKVIPVQPGAVFTVGYWAKQSNAALNNNYTSFWFTADKPASGLYITQAEAQAAVDVRFNATTPTSWTYYEHNVTIPAGKYWMTLVFQNFAGSSSYLSVDKIVLKQQLGDAFIASLKASKIVAETIGAGLIFADQIKQASYVAYQAGSNYGPMTQLDTSLSGGVISLDTDTDTITKAGTAGWNAAIASPTFARIERGNGYTECVVGALAQDVMFGLTANFNTAFFTVVDFAWYINGSGTLDIYEGGSLMLAAASTYAIGDRLRVAIEDGFVRYYKNEQLYYTSPNLPTASIRGFSYSTTGGYRGVVAIATVGGKVKQFSVVQAGYGSGWRLNPLFGTQVFDIVPIWTGSVGTISINNGGRTLTKPSGSNAWDSKVNSLQAIASGDGYIQFTVQDNNIKSYMVGLSSSALVSGAFPTTFDFSILISGDDGKSYAYERGVQVSTGITYAQGDVFRISIEGGIVKYRRNGEIIWTSTNQNFLSYPVFAKVGILAVGTTVGGFSFTASSSGSGEFNSGITVVGERLEDTVRLVRNSIRKSDNKWRGTDTGVPATGITSAGLSSLYIPFEENRVEVVLYLNIDDYLTNTVKNLDTVDYIRVRAFDWFGNSLLPQGFQDFPYNGRGMAGVMWHTRNYADPQHQALYSVQLHNIFGLSQPIYFTAPNIPWTNFGARAGTFINYGSAPPTFKNSAYHPSNLVAIAISETSASLSWSNPSANPSSNVSINYRVYKSEGYTEAAPGWVFVGVTNTANQVVTGLLPNTRYEFMVDAHSAGGLNDGYLWANFAYLRMPTTPPPAPSFPAPTGVTATATGITTMNVTWTGNGSPTNVEISRRNVTTNGAWSVINAAYAGTQPYADSGLSQSTTYAYKIRNNYSGNFSNFSSEGQGTTNTPAPASNTPTNLVVIPLSYYSARASWTTNGGGSNHRIEFVQDTGVSDFTGATVVTGASSPNTFFGLISGATYRFRVRAESPTVSAWSNDALVTTPEYIEPEPDACVLPDTIITAMDEQQRQYTLTATEIVAGQRLVSIASNGERTVGKVKSIFNGSTTRLYTILTETGQWLTCSPGHPIIIGYGGKVKKAFELTTKDTILVYNQHSDKATESRIASIEYVDINSPVIIFEMENDEHTFVSGGIVSHNIRAKL